MNIITLTLNPAFDVHCTAEIFAAGHENIAKIISRDAGGKGINISRALINNGVESTAFAVLGDENGREFCDMLTADGLSVNFVTLPGRIRENITVHTKNAAETRLSFTGFSADDSVITKIEEKLESCLVCGDILTVTGRITDGVSVESVKKMILALKEKGVKIVIDSRSFSLDDIIECAPFLIKPNEEEISEYLKRDVTEFADIVSQAEKLNKAGIENVMVSLGKKGALLVCRDGVFTALPPEIRAVSTVGAGDSSIAGFIAAFSNGNDFCECLATAVSFGTAACLENGTRPPTAENIEKIRKSVITKRI